MNQILLRLLTLGFLDVAAVLEVSPSDCIWYFENGTFSFTYVAATWKMVDTKILLPYQASV
jgi:hypothetical protein